MNMGVSRLRTANPFVFFARNRQKPQQNHNRFQKLLVLLAWSGGDLLLGQSTQAVEQADFSAAVSQFAKAIIWKVESS
jgi:hypothetical protein